MCLAKTEFVLTFQFKLIKTTCPNIDLTQIENMSFFMIKKQSIVINFAFGNKGRNRYSYNVLLLIVKCIIHNSYFMYFYFSL